MRTENVKAILEGRKTQTRRCKGLDKFNENPDAWLKTFLGYDGTWGFHHLPNYLFNDIVYCKCPYGQVGDRLWVRETWRTYRIYDNRKLSEIRQTAKVWYKTTSLGDRTVDFDQQKDGADEWRPSIFMPRWASRIERTIALLRIERLLDISEADARAEGFNSIEEFLAYWDILNKKRGYGTNKNPWNWVIGW